MARFSTRLLGWVGGTMLAGLIAAAPAAADTFNTKGCTTWTVPAGVSSVSIDAVGAAGAAASGSNAGAGGAGAEEKGTAPATPGQVWDVCVNSGGGSSTGSGGDGGGASGVSGASNFGDPLVVAGGGGGGGIAGPLGAQGGQGGAGGAMNSGGGSSSTTNGPGAGAIGSSGGGAGGGGYVGGSAGAAAMGLTGNGGGGNGGTNYCNVSSCTTLPPTSPPQTPQVTLTYTPGSSPSGGPTVSITAPTQGAIYPLNASVASNFSCTGASSCADQNGRGSGAPIDTSTAGTHTFTVTAQSANGPSSASVAYTVAAPPRIFLALPSNGATYTVGQVVDSYFQCADGAGGPGLKSCADQNGQPSGAALDTSTPGNHAYTVTATSQDGLTASASATYRVIPPPVVTQMQAHRGGSVSLVVAAYGPGTIEVISVSSFRSFALAADVADVQPPLGSFVFGRGQVTATAAQVLPVRVGLTQAGRALLRDHRRAAITVMVFYTAVGATPELVKSQALRVSR